MKKIVLTVVAVLGMTTATWAEKTNSEMTTAVEETYNMEIDQRRLAVVLGLDNEQMDYLRIIHTNFCNDMDKAALAPMSERKALTAKAVKEDSKDMKYILTSKQYDKYMNLLHLTLKNKGIEY